MGSRTKHKWTFRARLRKSAFGWRSQPAIKRIKEAVSEIKKAARKDPVMGAEGAVLFLEKLSPALEHVDSSSGAIGTAVNNAINALAPIIAKAPADDDLRGKWLERLWDAIQEDRIPYIELLPDYWGELCVTPERASYWADEFIDNDSPIAIARACEEILLSSGMAEEAYNRYAIEANQKTTYLATFRATAKKYPHNEASDILGDLVASTPGDEGKWFAAAKSVGLYSEAVELANRTPCDPRTLTRAARDMEVTKPRFAIETGMAALRWLVEGYGYEITGMDVWAAYNHTMKAAENAEVKTETFERIRKLVAGEVPGDRFVTKVLGRELGLN